MATLVEVLVTCDSNNTLWTCCIWDHRTGTSLMTYKGGGTAEIKTLSFIGDNYLAAVEKTKPVLHVWPLNSHQTVQGIRFILPGRASAFAVTHDGSYCVAGIDEKIYLWQITSGNLLTIINRHYQKVVLLKFTPDGCYFISAAEDGMVMVWSLSAVAVHLEGELINQQNAGQHDPVYVFSDHSLPVTDLCVSKAGIHGRLCTVSSDRKCKIYDLSSGEMLLNLVFDAPLSSVVFDVLELNVFVGTAEGKICQFSLTNPPRDRELIMHNDENNLEFLSHTKAITCLSVSLDGETLMSGSNDESVILWHIHSRQPVRTIRHKGPITNGFFTVNFPAIYKQEFSPNIILHSLERTLEKDTDEITEIEVLVNKKTDFWGDFEHEKETECNISTNEIENEFSQKETSMKEEIDKLKNINANLYKFSIQKALSSIPTTNDNNNSNSSKKKKKRQRKN